MTPPVIVEDVDSSRSESAEVPESSLEIADYEHIARQYKMQKKERDRDTSEKATILNNLLVI